ncbi:MAG: hypothetical protein JSU70_01905 [Phycisphaerales bacterium]|nr:MAG: hypothetical protein JSU70_01905 [Phycisphaerales bacterium]
METRVIHKTLSGGIFPLLLGRTNLACADIDVNRDLAVDFKDVGTLSDYWFASDCGEENAWCAGADINQDTIVGYWGLAHIAANWLR